MGAESQKGTLIADFSIITVFDMKSTHVSQSIAKQEHRRTKKAELFGTRPIEFGFLVL